MNGFQRSFIGDQPPIRQGGCPHDQANDQANQQPGITAQPQRMLTRPEAELMP